MTFYNNKPKPHLDGTPIFQTEADRQREAEVAALLRERWQCDVTRFAPLSPIDWFAAREGRVVGLLELKSRDHNAGRYPTVFLAVRKWMALTHASAGMGTAGIFAVKFNDGIRWVSIWKVDATKQRIAGAVGPDGRKEEEPVIEVPIFQLKELPS